MGVLGMQVKMEILRILRNPYFVFWSLFMPILFYFIFTKIVNTGAADQSQWQAHYLMSMASFSVMGSAIMTLGIRMVQERTQGWSTFVRITPLSGSVYFFAKMSGQMVIHILSIIVIFIAGALINSVSLSLMAWIGSGLWLLIASLPFLGLGILVGTMKRVDTAAGVSNVVYMLLAITGGLWFPMDILPHFIQAIGKWLPAYNFGNGAWAIVEGKTPNLSNILILTAYLILFMIISNYIRKKQEAV
ncbi:ABC-2 type transport system permease protein [Scopulibacillus darangshiensis]|uniref:ABC-2 type transport system permease protein n=1 Tax=Scopulibacillus darangshiensis TaxID=442528 RepID=A0A4V2SMU9_9BACL|nr:ABC transporter permease [Scopulibacillus darangshiensis]TCP28736.1 ABC-2 type transport system permease protein [Scopulibacillus darangshiensis]